MLIKVRICFFAIVYILLQRNGFAQNSFHYPTSLSQFFNNYSLLNPAATGADKRITFRSGEQFHAGAYSRIRFFFSQVEYSLQRENKRSGHAFGISFRNNKEGNLLSFNRFYLQYAFRIALSDQWKLSSGVSTGLLNFSAEQTSTSGNVSSFAPDATLGLLLYREKERIGLSSAQSLNTSIQVINERIPIKRYYSLFYSRNFFLSPEVTFIPAILYSIKTEVSDMELNTSFLLKNLFFCGISYRHKIGSAYFLGIKDFLFLNGLTDLTISYNAPWPASNLGNIQTFEVLLSYKRDKKRKNSRISSRAQKIFY